MNEVNKFEKLIDKLILSFIFLFLVTLHNSIFLNQIGYFGALLLMLIKAVHLKKNPFNRTGLEWFFLLFIIAEVLSTIFSINFPNAFHNLIKRILLIPIVYVISSAADSREKAIRFFKIYAIAAFITLIIYIAFAYEHFVHQLYQLQAKGPSTFQYVMTAGGLISFFVVFMTAILINEKMSKMNKLLIAFALFISLLALGASYTRAAWIGTAGGILVIMILKKKWWPLAVISVLIIILFITQKNSSNFFIVNYHDNKVLHQIEYPGKLVSLCSDQQNTFFSAYENGVMKLKDGRLEEVIKTKSPVDLFTKWMDSIYCAFLVDQRVEVYKDTGNGFSLINEIISPGFTSDIQFSNNSVYIASLDSGLTVYRDPYNTTIMIRHPELKNIRRLAVNQSYLAFFTNDSLLKVFTLKDGLPDAQIFVKHFTTQFGFVSLINDHLLFTTETNTRLYRITDSNVIKEDQNVELRQVTTFVQTNNKLIAGGFSNKVFEIEYPIQNKLVIKDRKTFNFTPAGISFNQNELYLIWLRVSRLNSIVDPYHMTNIQRTYQWRAATEIFKDYPLFGVGDIDMKQVYTKYMLYFEKESFGHLHNNYFQILAALGGFGFIIVVILLVKIFITHYDIYQSLKHIKFASSYSLGAVGSFSAFLISGLAEWNFGDHEIITMVWFFLGLNIAFYQSSIKTRQKINMQEKTIG